MSRRTAMIVAPYFPPSGGGLERYAKNIATRLHDTHDWRIVVVTSGEHRGQDSVTAEDGLTVHRLSYDLKLSNSVLGFGWRKKLKKIIAEEKPDLINAHMPTPGLPDIVAGVCGNIPLVLTYHTGSMKKGSFAVDLLIRAYERFFLPRVLRRADRIVCSSDFVRDSFLCKYHDKAVTITPGVDETLFKPGPKRSSKHAAGPEFMLFVGNYGPSYHHKGLDDAITALGLLAKAHPKLELHIAGTGNNEQYRAQAKALGVGSKLKFHGWQDAAGLARIYSQAKLVVLPSRNDSFPLVLVDAMACGVPVVSTTVGGIPTVVDDGATGLLVPPEHPAALANAIGRVLENGAFAARLGAAGHAKVLRSLTWTQKALATHKLYEQVVRPHVCQITAYYPPHLGGVENMVQELSLGLAAAGCTVDVLTSRAGGVAPADETPAPNVRVRRLWGPEFLHTPLLPGLLPTLLRQPAGTVYHLHVAQAGLPELALLAAKLRHRALIAHVHLDVEPSSLAGKYLLGPYKQHLLKMVLRRANRVVVLTADQGKLVTAKYQVNPDRLTVLPNGVATGYFAPAHATFHKPLRLLFVGRLAIQKRPERIVEAMKLLPNAQLEVVGDGPDRAKLEAYTQQHDLKNVNFRGVLRGAELRKAYAAADLLVLPSDQEGMPLTLLEGMAAGLPIMGSDVVGIRELITGTGVLVSKPSPETFAAAIKKLASRPAELERLSQASRAAADLYSWDRLTGEVKTLYEEVRA
jgi:glycosyltransferase involved in cell wall biosynthesis